MRGDYNLESGSCAGSITGACHVTIGISGACARAGAVWPVRCGCDLRLPAGRPHLSVAESLSAGPRVMLWPSTGFFGDATSSKPNAAAAGYRLLVRRRRAST